MATVQGGSVVKSSSYAELTPAEQAAARKALAGLGVEDLLVGQGNDTYSGGVAQAGSFVAAFAGDTQGGGNLFTPGNDVGVQLSSDPFALVGPTAQGVANDLAQGSFSQVVTFGDQTTVNLIGINSHNGQ